MKHQQKPLPNYVPPARLRAEQRRKGFNAGYAARGVDFAILKLTTIIKMAAEGVFDSVALGNDEITATGVWFLRAKFGRPLSDGASYQEGVSRIVSEMMLINSLPQDPHGPRWHVIERGINLANRIIAAVDLMLPTDGSQGDQGAALYRMFLYYEPGATGWQQVLNDLSALIKPSNYKGSDHDV